MQKNELTLRAAKAETSFTLRLSLAALTATLELQPLFHRLAKLYSEMLDDEVTALQAVYYFYAQIMALLTLLPVTMNLGWRACFLTLFCVAVSKANKQPQHRQSTLK